MTARPARPLDVRIPRLLAVAILGVAIVASLVATPPALAATPRAGVGVPLAATTGQATHYEAIGGGTTNGNCSFPALPADKLYVAVGPAQYANGAACGTYLDVKGPNGTVRVVVMDKCPECGPGHLDLSKTAFSKIAKLSDGLVKVSYSTVTAPKVPGMSFRFKDGTSQWWFALQILDHGTELKSVSVKVAGVWKATTKADYNYWIYEPGAGRGPNVVKITDIYGRSAEVSGIRLLPTVVQKTPAKLTQTTSKPVTVVRAIDGDTVVLSSGSRINLIGIDAPPIGVRGGPTAQKFATSFLVGKAVTLTTVVGRRNLDTDGAYLRYMSVGGKDYGMALLATGWARARYDSRDGYGWHPFEQKYIAQDAKYPTP